MNSSCQKIPTIEQYHLFGVVAPTTEEDVSSGVNGAPSTKAAQPPSISPAPDAEVRDDQLDLDLPPVPFKIQRRNDYRWTDEDVETVRLGLLKCLSWLADGRTSPEERHEWIAWVASPFRGWRELSMHFEGPFSFQVCCLAAGADPEEFRDQILWKYAPARARFLQAVDDWRAHECARRVTAKFRSQPSVGGFDHRQKWIEALRSASERRCRPVSGLPRRRQRMNLKIKRKDYSLREAFGFDFPSNQHIMGFENIGCPFVPRRNPLWHWDREVLRDLMQWWEDDESSDRMALFGPNGSGPLAALHQFCNALQIPCYDSGVHEGAEFEAFAQRFQMGRGQVSHIALRNADGSITIGRYTHA